MVYHKNMHVTTQKDPVKLSQDTLAALYKVGQSHEILYQFGSILAAPLAISEAYPATEPVMSGVESFFQNTKLFTWRM